MLNLRIFTRREARTLEPGDVIERPHEAQIDEVTKTFGGLRIAAYPLAGRADRRITFELKPDDPIEAPVSDQDTLAGILQDAFSALVRQIEDDDADTGTADGTFAFEWLAQERAFNVRTPSGWVLLAFEHSGGGKGRPEKPVKATKAAKATKSAPPPADAEPDVST